ncbi:hypothetical protein MJO28_011536 [Puccinia striiformis f. sp. tritici]|uniref:Uncharacterized protein n=2 Tax=Puccinia striiformis TaxID=27350 RepID=A0A2S4WJE4_9BASI|nr:hypothetical protein Pst134EB_021967 [Puccinia striiformis f. sp. tritici]KAI7944008.1 hypothetical protein MJO28_011536 [Puccinia striiformis f. sp. tritici]KAI9599680.1 hypothetical protein KEM48_008894 [Puccinia striiformis f. sp. tritici PST-130]POW21872.1 hypothetical protein PSHT_01860 [Puccinia striiformis]
MDNRTFQELTKIHEEHQAEKLESTNRRIKSYLAAHARLESVENAKAFDRRAHLATKQLGPYAGKLDRNGRATWPLGADESHRPQEDLERDPRPMNPSRSSHRQSGSQCPADSNMSHVSGFEVLSVTHSSEM